jgi:hypothetical protein
MRSGRILTFLLFLLVIALKVHGAEILVSMKVGRVFYKEADGQPLALQPGKCSVGSDSSILTFIDGQVFIEAARDTDLRMREESILGIHSADDFSLRKGLAGFRTKNRAIRVRTVHGDISMTDGMLVLKSNPVLTRFCLIKGKAVISYGKRQFELAEGFEIAASAEKISRPYKESDELRYAWYWVAPEKEPALQ